MEAVLPSHTSGPLGCLVSGLPSSAIFLQRVRDSEKEGWRQRMTEAMRSNEPETQRELEKERQSKEGPAEREASQNRQHLS